MRARGSLWLVVAALLIPARVAAEPAHPRGLTLGLTAVQPLPPWKDAGFGAAPWAGLVLPTWRHWSATVRAGWIRHLDQQQTVGSESAEYRNWELPVLAGLEYSHDGGQGLLLAAELGYVLHHTAAEYRHAQASSHTDHGAGLSLGVGYRIHRFQARAQYMMLGIPDPVKMKALVFGIQWTLPM